MSRNVTIGRCIGVCVVAFGIGLAAWQCPAARAMQIEVDYTGDTFFASHATAKAALEAAAADVSNWITTMLGPTMSQFEGEANGTTSTFDTSYSYNSPASGGQVSFGPSILNADEFVLFVGVRHLGGNTLGVGAPGGLGASAGASIFDGNDLQAAVDQATAAASASLGRGAGPTIGTIGGNFGAPFQDVTFSISYGAGIGSAAFDVDTDNDGFTDDLATLNDFWHFDHTTAVDPDKFDFYSIALHEILHTLGVGSSETWESLMSGNDWLGEEVIALLGSGEDLISGDGSHLALGLMSMALLDGALQEAVMTPSLTNGERRTLTQLDAAILRDIHWSIVPEPATAVLLALGALGMLRRPRKQMV